MILLLAVLALPLAVDATPAATRAEPLVLAADHPLTVANHASQPIIALRLSSARDDDWGDDRLGPQQTIAPGHSVTLHLQGPDCAWDAQATYRDGSTEERRRLDVCRVRSVAFDGSRAADGDDGGDEGGDGQDQASHDASLRNDSGRTITEIYVSPRNARDWGDDRLGDNQLASGHALSVVFTGGCRQDVRVVYDNNSAEERRGVDLCAHPRLRISPGWVLPDRPGGALPRRHGDGDQGDGGHGEDGQGDEGQGDKGPGDAAPETGAPESGGQHIGVILPQGSVLRLTR